MLWYPLQLSLKKKDMCSGCQNVYDCRPFVYGVIASVIIRIIHYFYRRWNYVKTMENKRFNRFASQYFQLLQQGQGKGKVLCYFDVVLQDPVEGEMAGRLKVKLENN